VSGYGAEVSDEASAQMIGREAIRRALWAYDGRAMMTPLAEAVLTRFDKSPEAVIAFVHQARPTDYGSFAPIVFEFALRRDPLALALVREAAAEAVRIILRLLEAGAPSVCLLGGLAAPLTEWLPPPIQARLAAPKGDALDGAILMAKRACAERHPAAAHA
jgi:glucosamine kinase